MFKYRRRKYKEENKNEKQLTNEESKKVDEDIEKINVKEKINGDDMNKEKNNVKYIEEGNGKDKNNDKNKQEEKDIEKKNNIEKEKEKGNEKDKNNEKKKDEDKEKNNNEKNKMEDKEKDKNNEKEKDNDKNQFVSPSNKKPIKRYKYRFYSKNRNEEEIKNDNNNNNNEQSSLNEEKLENNDNQIIKISKKELILEKLKEIVPIIEDKEEEDNITPNKPIKNNDIDIDSTSLINNMFKNEFQNDNEDSINAQSSNNAIKSEEKNSKKFYDNELIDAILDVEKYNVNNYLSKDLADIYNEINKDNVFFKNNVFLSNIDNFERKTGNLDKLKNKKFYNNDEDLNDKLKEISKTNEIINKYTEKSKYFK